MKIIDYPLTNLQQYVKDVNNQSLVQPTHIVASKSGKIREFYFQSEKIKGKEKCFGKSEKRRKVIESILFHFGEVTFSMLNHTSS